MLSDDDRTAFLKAVDDEPSSWPILRLQRGDERLHMFYAYGPDGVATLRAELHGAVVYDRTFSVVVSAEQTATDIRAELRRFRREHIEQGWEELAPILWLTDEMPEGE